MNSIEHGSRYTQYNTKTAPLIALSIVAVVLWIFPGCAQDAGKGAVPAEAYFVRGGVAIECAGVEGVSIDTGGNTIDWASGGAGGAMYGKDMAMVELDWRPGDSVVVKVRTSGGRAEMEIRAPLMPSPMSAAVVDLERVEVSGTGMGAAPDTSLAFSPEGERLAIGSYRGFLRVLDIGANEIALEKKLAEGMVKQVGWGSAGGREVLYVGEQSPDGFLYCLDAGSGEKIWRYRMADDIGTSAPVEGHERYAMYHYPGVFRIIPSAGGGVVAIGAHGWFKDEKYTNKTVVYKFDADTGEVLWRWPAKNALPYGITWLDTGRDGETLVLVTSSWYGVDIPATRYKNGAVYCIDLKSGRVR